MVVTRWNSMWWINLLEWTVNPFQSSRISQLQDFYWLSFEDMFDTDIMAIKWVKPEDLDYILENRELEFAKKSTVWFELRDVQWKEEYKKLQEYYGFSLEYTQDTDKLVKLWMEAKDILYITGKDIDKKNEPVWTDELKMVDEKDVNKGEDVIIDNIVFDSETKEEIWYVTKQAEQSGDIGGIELLDEISELREQYKKEFGKYPSSQMKLETLKKKLWVTS